MLPPKAFTFCLLKSGDWGFHIIQSLATPLPDPIDPSQSFLGSMLRHPSVLIPGDVSHISPFNIFTLNCNSLLKNTFLNNIISPHTTTIESTVLKSILNAQVSCLTDTRLRNHELQQIKDLLHTKLYIHSNTVPDSAYKHAGS